MQPVDDQDYEALLKRAGDSNPEEKANILARLVAHLRSKLSRLKVQFNSLKQESSDQINGLKSENAALVEKQARLQEEGFEKRRQLLHQIE